MSTGKLVLAAILGGITLFLWGMVSHELLPLYKNSLLKFTNEEAVAQAIVANAPAPGVYFMPYVPQDAKGMSADEFKAAQNSAMERLKHGPFMFASVRLGEFGSFASTLSIQLMSDIFCALLLALIVMKASGQSYGSRVLVCVFVALAAFAVKTIPMWNWYNFSGAFTFAELIDLVGRMFFAGVVISKVLPAGSKA